MALESEPIELPLFVGMGEQKDSQLRTTDAVVSENVSFQKSGAIKTRRYLDVVAQHTADLEGVTYADGEFYVNSADQLMKVNADNALGNPTTFSLPRIEEVSYLKTSSMTVGWVRAITKDTSVVVSWLESRSVGYAIKVALFDDEDNLIQAPLEVYSGVIPSYEMVETPTGVAFVFATAGVGNPTNGADLITAFYTASSSTITAGSSHTQTLAAGYAKSVSACVRTTDVLVAVNQWPDTTPSSHGSQEGTTFLMSISFAGSITSVVLSSDGTPTVNAGHILCTVGYDAVEDTSWLAVVNSMKIQVAEVTGVTPGTLSDLTTLSPSGLYAATPLYNRIPSNDPVHFAQLMCGRFIFSGTSRYFVATSYDHPVIPTSLEVYPRNYAHLAVFSLPAVPAAADFTYFCPHTLLGGLPYIEATGNLLIPVVVSDCWVKDWEDTTGPYLTRKTTSVGVQNMVAGAAPFVAFNETQASQPLYYTAGIAEIVNGELVITSVFGFDEVRPQNGVTLGLNLDEGSLLQQTRCEAYNEPIGGLVTVGETLKYYHPRRRVQAGVPNNGNGSPSLDFRQPDTWNHTLAVANLSARQKLFLEGGRDFLVASTGFASVVDEGRVFPTSFLVPPDLNATVYSGSGADTRVRKFVAVWAWLDSKGIYHRGPPSHEVQAQFRLWDTRIDTATTHVAGYPTLQGLDSDQVFLEVYAEPVAGGVVVPGSFTLFHRTSAEGRVPSVTLHMQDSDVEAPLLYTTGGVLPNEARPAQGRLVIAKGRVWTFDKNQVFYSNEVGVDLPVEFNSNLFIHSPDGTPFTGIATMDEQVVLFTQRGIHVARGQGVNRLGAGPGFNLASVTTPTGCRSETSIVETDIGVVFLGERGLHILKRDFKVEFLGNTEDTLEGDIISAAYDRTAKEVLFVTELGTFVLDMLSGLWTKVNVARSALSDITWTVDGLAAVADDTLLRTTGTILDTFPKNTSPPMKHSTPWVHVGTAQSSQRISHILIQGHGTIGEQYIPATRDVQGSIITASEVRTVDSRATLTVKLYVDHDEEPCLTKLVDLRTLSLSPLEIRVLNPRQRCRALRVEICTEEANLDLTLTSIVAMAGRKRGADKRQITAGT